MRAPGFRPCARAGRFRAATLAAALLAATAVPAVASAPIRLVEPVVLADGHVDLAPRLDDAGWSLQIREGAVGSPVWRDPGDVVLQVPASSVLVVPADARFAFLGPVGSTLWTLPQVQAPGVVWPGWSTEDPGVVSRLGGDVTWRLEAVRGPGPLQLFLTGDFGTPEVLFDTAEALPQDVSVPRGTHTHGNWTFAGTGAYELDVTMSAPGADGSTLSDAATLRVFVGDGDPRAAFDGQDDDTAHQHSPTVSSGIRTPDPTDVDVELAGNADPADGDGGSPVSTLAGIGAAAVFLALAGTLLMARRRRTGGAR